MDMKYIEIIKQELQALKKNTKPATFIYGVIHMLLFLNY